ncbi:hypothetical protein AUEXF2481DRAFT_35681 [Aureobasidium subglaciale EXF-2481]|uniref:Uncharacterized protein n=1 Tax=Aureobasidium subglaciale (strain EXF-2481) TaxID=1043005 RepID=A0A074YPX0_AURSE|nr:uncharacterized protein AUEXF2481DRAFT_35681 [Aureobasidium subglaciale EXF-2481]KEQ99750.1 hypothetical protein AUEXF2481DRAFT_35681 [Aureobasidium subglaciale EXF-2481]
MGPPTSGRHDLSRRGVTNDAVPSSRASSQCGCSPQRLASESDIDTGPGADSEADFSEI